MKTVITFDAKDYWDLAYENGAARLEDALKHNAPQKKQVQRTVESEAKSLLPEIAVAVLAGRDPESICLFVPREWNGKSFVLPSDAQKPDVGRVEVRRGNSLLARLDTYGKDYVDDAVVLQSFVEDRLVHLTGFVIAREDWKADRIPTASHRRKRYPHWAYRELRDMSTFDWGWAQ